VDDILQSAVSAAAQQTWATQNLRLYVYLEPGFDPDLNFKNAKLSIPNSEFDYRYYQLQGSVTVTIVVK
jgi:hypothetical protein